MIRSFSWEAATAVPVAQAVDVVPEVPKGGWVWVDVADSDPATLREVGRHFRIPGSLISEALATGSLPMIEEQRDLIYVVLNAFRTIGEHRLGQSEVDLFIGPDFVVSVHAGDVIAVSTVIERFEQGIALGVPTPAGLMAHLAMLGSRRFPTLIDQLETQLEDLEELAMRADPRALPEVHASRRDVIVIRRVVLSQRQIFEELAQGGHPLIDEASRVAFEKVADYQGELIDAIDTTRSLLVSVLETHRAAVADQTNEIVRVLTVFSAILLPLTLISGIFGMNFADIPLTGNPVGFWILVGAMATGAVTLWVYFGRRGFVGRVRLSDLPKAVGLGLYHVGTAPIRVVADGIETTYRLVTGNQSQEDDDPAT